MYLKSLQLIGFKSFAEKTTLEFLPGVTAIVGPNGCGKSNISDAIRWVLGEQSAKALRGSEMADVIFSGTDGRKAIGMCEVSMSFAEVDPTKLSLPGVNLDFTEVTITRRVYRDGNGEYFINKTPCRLRDIQGLFMDTGIGRSSYSMMAQGQIDQILSARPEDRRTIFEEAAGINKYKHQKKEALRKLEYTEQNLVRLTDIIKEVKRQIISLQRQAGKARRFKELFDQVKALDTRLQRHRYDLLQTEIADLEAQIIALAAQSEQYAAQIGAQEQQITDLRRSLREIEGAISETVTQDHELKSEADRHQHRITSNTERTVEYEQLIRNHRLEIAGNEEKIRNNEQDLARLNAEFDQIDTELASAQEQFRTQQEALRQLDAELTEKNRTFEAAKSAIFELDSQLARNRNELTALDQRQAQDLIRTERLSTEKLQIEDNRRAVAQRLQDFNAGVDQLRATVEELRLNLAGATETAATAARELAAATSAHRSATTEGAQKRARLDVLRQFFAAPDGRQTLGQVLEVEPAYGAAVEAALNGKVHTILADDRVAARELLTGELKNPSVAAPDFARTSSLMLPLPANARRAADVVRVHDERFAPLVQSLLANVVIVENLDVAEFVCATLPGVSAATVKGEFLSATGILSLVSTSHIAEIAALTEEVSRLERATGERATRQAEWQQQQAGANETLSQARAELHTQELALASKQGELNTLATEQRDLDSKVHTVIFELSSLEQQSQRENERRAELARVVLAAESREQQLRADVVAAQQAVAELAGRKAEMTEALTEMRVHAAGIEHRRASIQQQREPLAGRIRDLRDRMTTCANEITSYTAKSEQLLAEVAESEQEIAAVSITREQVQHQLSGFQHQRREVATGIEHAETELRQIRLQAAESQNQKAGFDVTVAQKRMEMQGLQERVWQKYQLNVEDIRSESITITVADQGPAVSEQVPLPTDWDAIELEVTELQSKLDAMGPVNAEAIQEYDELEERHQFLSQQHEDLVKAKEQLLQVIAKINSTTKQLFTETFEKVRTNFQQMFTELFGGGKANLLLLDESDPLECGIEIVAKPPGKQLQSITLLSGGEKTLTATALLFSIYMVKPSPFCVLDELDAPLDESNINRFVRVLQRFITMSQFVIITHNKRTIGMADALYGITMEEHGVSKVVSVKFSPREETTRRAEEKAREAQEDRIDGAAVPADSHSPADKSAFGLLPHEEDLRNDLLVAKEQTVAPIPEAPAAVAETVPTLNNAAPADLKAEVQAAVAAATEVTNSVAATVAESELVQPTN